MSLQRLPPRLSGPLHPEPGLVSGEQVPAEVLENQADAHQSHREERGRTCGGVRCGSGRQAGGQEDREMSVEARSLNGTLSDSGNREGG